ncbi:sulfatase-like hydrolase/transferase [Peristeroidobacter soli]|uniref:sulfatase-like hydrolase/transferase n=1 Tax=Peristeroidobacter soli TaxID=2497877 RepID=UPI001300BABF|nr:sulfatase-like hydrolase/transferase [Peristeroidobacter soli]
MLLAFCIHSSAIAAPPPNIVIILADDLGYGDVGAYNPESKIGTPHIDQLARQGMRFVDAHSAATCVPSRYELLTGRRLFRNDRKFETQALIAPQQPTLASVLSQAGYATAMIGKWHLGFEGLGVHPSPSDYTQPLRGGPIGHGFSSYFGLAASLDVPPYVFLQDDRFQQGARTSIPEHHTPGMRSIQGEFWRAGMISTDFKHEEVLGRLADRAVEYLQAQAGARQPFFLYVALTAPHPPWLPTEPFRGQSGAGMYGDFVMQMDAEVGRIVDALERAGKANDTLLLFTSDNGPTWYEADILRYGHRAVGGLRGMKGDAWEGGHRIPFVARWPGEIAAGTTSTTLVSFTDIMGTVASVTGQTIPASTAEDSFNLLPVFLSKSLQSGREVLVHEAVGPDGRLLALRWNQWKWIPSGCMRSMFEGFGEGALLSNPCAQRPPVGQPPGQLYDLSNDLGERENVYAQHPKLVEQLTERLNRYRGTERTSSSGAVDRE